MMAKYSKYLDNSSGKVSAASPLGAAVGLMAKPLGHSCGEQGRCWEVGEKKRASQKSQNNNKRNEKETQGL